MVCNIEINLKKPVESKPKANPPIPENKSKTFNFLFTNNLFPISFLNSVLLFLYLAPFLLTDAYRYIL